MSRGVTRVYVGNLGSNGIKSEIEREFSKFGVIRDVWVARNPPGFAFVEFNDHRDAEDAIKELDGRRVCGVRVQVELSNHQGRSSRKPPPSNRGRSHYSPENRYGDRYGPPRGRYDDDRYARYATIDVVVAQYLGSVHASWYNCTKPIGTKYIKPDTTSRLTNYMYMYYQSSELGFFSAKSLLPFKMALRSVKWIIYILQFNTCILILYDVYCIYMYYRLL